MRRDIEVYADPLGGVSAPRGVIAAPDGGIWFTSVGDYRLGRLHPVTGVVESFADDRIRLDSIGSIDAAPPEPRPPIVRRATGGTSR